MLIICSLFESDAGVGIPTPILRLFSAVRVCVFACRRQLAFLLSFITPPRPARGAEYCDKHVCLSVCVSRVREHISRTVVRSSPAFLHVTVLLLRRCDTLSTSGFVDDVAFACTR